MNVIKKILAIGIVVFLLLLLVAYYYIKYNGAVLPAIMNSMTLFLQLIGGTTCLYFLYQWITGKLK